MLFWIKQYLRKKKEIRLAGLEAEQKELASMIEQLEDFPYTMLVQRLSLARRINELRKELSYD